MLTVSQACRHWWARASLLQAVRLQLTIKTATIQYKPVTSLAGNNMLTTHLHITNSHVATFKCYISHALSNILGCTSAAVISVTSYPDIVWIRVSSISPTNGQGTRLTHSRLPVFNIIAVSILRIHKCTIITARNREGIVADGLHAWNTICY